MRAHLQRRRRERACEHERTHTRARACMCPMCVHVPKIVSNRELACAGSDETDKRKMDRVPGGYAFTPPVRSEHMSMSEFFARSRRASGRECVYLQHALMGSDPQGNKPGLHPSGSMGEQMMSDLASGLNHRLLGSIAECGRFGPAQRCQLFVGAAAAAHARTVLHFDQYDNVFIQLSGRKTFLLFDPAQSGCLAPYPIHHPLDRSAQVGLENGLPTATFPRASQAGGCRVTLGPGDVLVLPCYWWHEGAQRPAPRAPPRDAPRCPALAPPLQPTPTGTCCGQTAA